MLNRVIPVEYAAADPGGATARLRDAERTLERSKRDLAEAVVNARRLEQRIAEARRQLEQSRWVNAASGNPELARAAAVSLATQSAAIETVEKSISDIAARITRLQSRVERQSTRLFDLQTRLRNNEGARDVARNGGGAKSPDEAGQGRARNSTGLSSREDSDVTLWPRLWRATNIGERGRRA